MSRIMIVDDDPDILELVGEYLKSAGHSYVPVESGVKCLEVVDEEDPDLILMDIRMPELDGWETIREMGKRGVGKGIPIVALTVEDLNLRKMVRQSIENLTGYIEKPFTKSELLETIDNIVGKIEEIQNLKARIGKVADHGSTLAESYESITKKQILHERLLWKLEEIRSERGADYKLPRIEDLTESEKNALKMLKLRKAVIERIAGIEESDD